MNRLNEFLFATLLLFCAACNNSASSDYFLKQDFQSEWNVKADNFIDSMCRDLDKRTFMRKQYALLLATKKRDYVLSKFANYFSSDLADFNMVEEFSEDNAKVIIYVRQLESKIVSKFEFNLSNDGIRQDTISFDDIPSIAQLSRDIENLKTCCPYLKGSHNPIMTVYTSLGSSKNGMDVKNVLVLLE
jgi:hypothetical protein